MKVKLELNRSVIIQSTAELLAERIKNHSEDRPFILGLSTGVTVLSICQELASFVKKGACSLKDVIIFYAGEYISFSKTKKAQYVHHLTDDFFSQVDLLEKNIHIPDGNAIDLDLECKQYEEKIAGFGGIDLFLGSLGETGNLAFNEPFSSLSSRTRVKTLTAETIRADARFFDKDIYAVPSQAITIGMQTIFDSKEVIIVVYGVNKAFAIKSCLDSPVSAMHPASILQLHPDTTFIIDRVAGRLLNPILSMVSH